ncbi:uncharacterized protein METZ01_LOCUS217187 [marine metagenome]|uniref:Uncharacterized protein n=1 Tax=marine metagenome TaxID=408172 RepID=A0A382FQ35_9ZZZZ
MYFELWRKDLSLLFEKFQNWRTSTEYYFPKVFIFFVLINDIAFWFALATAFPGVFSENELGHYMRKQIPVAFLGALFDSLSLYLTILVIRRALLVKSNLVYISHLGIDVFIAIVATFWVLFVFSISGWIVSFLPQPETVVEQKTLEERNEDYANLAIAAINNPTGREEMKNIYFGIVMGLSAIIPTCVHIFYAVFALRIFLKPDRHRTLT